MNDILKICFIACPLVFIAGFVDSIAGGGGVISLPAYLLAGLPIHTAMGTNKVANGMGTIVSTTQYILKKKADISIGLLAAAGSLLGGFMGSSLALFISEDILNIVMLIVLPIVAVFLFIKKDFGKNSTQEKNIEPVKKYLFALAIGLLIGGYDGLIGPGTGTFFIIIFSLVYGFDLLKSSGCSKLANLASNIASAVTFIISGKIVFMVAIPAACCAMLGNFIGSRLALKRGSGFIRYIMFIVLALLVVKMIYDLI